MATRLLSEFHEYLVPIVKLRFAITGGQSLPGTDVLVLRAEQGRLTEVSFVESKVRTARAIRESGILMDVHPGLLSRVSNDLAATTFPRSAWLNNLLLRHI